MADADTYADADMAIVKFEIRTDESHMARKKI